MSEATTTAYAAAKALNVKLREEGLPEIATQYAYSEIKRGKLSTVSNDSKKIAVEVAKEWIQSQLNARRNGENVKSAATTEMLLDGIS